MVSLIWGAISIFGCYLFLKKKKDIRLRRALGFGTIGSLDLLNLASLLPSAVLD